MDPNCPKCGEDVPLVLRGVVAYCAACGHPRPALGKKILHVTGQPAKIGGTVAKVAAGTVFGIGTFFALLITLVLQTTCESNIGLAIGLPIEFITLLITFALYFGGRMLGKAGSRADNETRMRALRGLAKQHKGILTAATTAKALRLDEKDADALLTKLAQDPDEDVGIEFTDEGEVLYLIGSPDAKRFQIRVEAAGLGDVIMDEIPEELEAEFERKFPSLTRD